MLKVNLSVRVLKNKSPVYAILLPPVSQNSCKNRIGRVPIQIVAELWSIACQLWYISPPTQFPRSKGREYFTWPLSIQENNTLKS